MTAQSPRCLSCVETLKRVVGDGLSLARFGDGESRLAFTQRSLLFQPWSPGLQSHLRAVAQGDKPGVLATFNHYYRDHWFVEWVAHYERYPKKFTSFRSVKNARDIGVLRRPRDALMYARYWSKIGRISKASEWGDTSVFYLGCYVKEYEESQIGVIRELFAKLFHARSILFVAPEEPLGGASFAAQMEIMRKLGVRTVDFIAIPSVDAYASYNQIRTEIERRRASFSDVFIQAGPTATILAHELGGGEQRVLDVGSLNTQLRYLLEPTSERILT